jgi:hypothetical protein
LGYTFLVSEIVVPVALGIGFESASHWNYKQYKGQRAKTLNDHKNYYKDYKKYHYAAIWSPVVSFVGIYAINILCNYYCTKIDPKSSLIETTPAPFFDSRGNFGMGISIDVKF